METDSKMGALPGAGTPEEMDRLDGWQEIADHVGVSVRAAQRYARELGMPVYRLTPRKVRAYKSRLDAWESRKADPAPAAAPLHLVAANG